MTGLSEEMKEDFLDAYMAADDNQNGEISPERFLALMVALGVPGGMAKAQKLLGQFVGESLVVGKEQYLDAVKHAKLKTTQIQRYKAMFKLFDKKKAGWVSQKSMESGLTEMGIPVEGEIHDKIKEMHKENGKISFSEFLRVQLKMPSTR